MKLLVSLLFTFSLSFFLIRSAPGNARQVLLGENFHVGVSVKQEKTLSIIKDYFLYLKSILKLDLGYSFYSGKLVLTLLKERLIPTLFVSFVTLFFSIVLVFVLGFFYLFKKSVRFVIDLIMAILSSFPVFLIGIAVFYTLVLKLKITSMFSYSLPIITLTLTVSPPLFRTLKTSLLSEVKKEYFVSFFSMGVPLLKIYVSNLLPNAFLPFISTFGLYVSLVVGSSPIVEKLFSFPGLGSLLIDSIFLRDYAVLQGCVIFLSILNFVIIFLTELLHKALFPMFEVKHS